MLPSIGSPPALVVATTLLLLLCLFSSQIACVFGQIPCDDAYGAFCAEESGWGVQACLKKVGTDASLSAECFAYMAVHDACESDIKQHCPGKEFTGK